MTAVLLSDMLVDDVLGDMLPQAASKLMRPVAMMSLNMMFPWVEHPELGTVVLLRKRNQPGLSDKTPTSIKTIAARS